MMGTSLMPMPVNADSFVRSPTTFSPRDLSALSMMEGVQPLVIAANGIRESLIANALAAGMQTSISEEGRDQVVFGVMMPFKILLGDGSAIVGHVAEGSQQLRSSTGRRTDIRIVVKNGGLYYNRYDH